MFDPYSKSTDSELFSQNKKKLNLVLQFLEDYDDERDDPKYYKGRELQRRLAERVREADQDAKDRNKEQEGEC